VADRAQRLPAQGPLASGSDGDAFAASILVEPGAEEAQQAPAQHSPPWRPAEAAQSSLPAAAPSPEPVDAASDEPVAGRGPGGQPPAVDAAPAQPAFAADEPIIPVRPPMEPPGGDREVPPSQPDAVEPDAHLGQPEATTLEASYPSPTAAAEPDFPPAAGLEQPLSSQSAPAPPPESNPAADTTPDSALDASVAHPSNMLDRHEEQPSGEPAMLVQDEPSQTPLPDAPASREAVPADDHESRPKANADVSVSAGAGSNAKADDGCIGDAAAASVSAAPRADRDANRKQVGRAADPEPLFAEGTQPADMGPAAVEHDALPDSADAPDAANQGGGTVPAEPARPGDHGPHAMAEPNSQPPAASGRICLRYALRSCVPLILQRPQGHNHLGLVASPSSSAEAAVRRSSSHRPPSRRTTQQGRSASGPNH